MPESSSSRYVPGRLYLQDNGKSNELRVSKCPLPRANPRAGKLHRSDAGVPAERLVADVRHALQPAQKVWGVRGDQNAQRGCDESIRPRGTPKHCHSPVERWDPMGVWETPAPNTESASFSQPTKQTKRYSSNVGAFNDIPGQTDLHSKTQRPRGHA